MKDAVEQLLLHEFDQAWDHYRHVENQRVWYVYFWFLVAGAAGGFVTAIVAQGGYDTHHLRALAGCLFLGAAVFVVSVFTYVAVARLAPVLGHYEFVWNSMRCRLGVDEKLFEEVNIRDRGGMLMSGHPLFSVQKNAEGILWLSSLAVLLALGVTTVLIVEATTPLWSTVVLAVPWLVVGFFCRQLLRARHERAKCALLSLPRPLPTSASTF